jgi:hypothetical protein
MDEVLDAGGRPMELGGLYAYINNNNGATTFVLGALEEVYKDGHLDMAKLSVIKRRKGYKTTAPQVVNISTSRIKCANLINVSEEYKNIL